MGSFLKSFFCCFSYSHMSGIFPKWSIFGGECRGKSAFEDSWRSLSLWRNYNYELLQCLLCPESCGWHNFDPLRHLFMLVAWSTHAEKFIFRFHQNQACFSRFGFYWQLSKQCFWCISNINLRPCNHVRNCFEDLLTSSARTSLFFDFTIVLYNMYLTRIPCKSRTLKSTVPEFP